jgi:nitric oxide reductase NorQ protein
VPDGSGRHFNMNEPRIVFDTIDSAPKNSFTEAPIRQTKEDVFLPEPSNGFVTTQFVDDITERALTYLRAGYPVHFSGPAGTGKTTLAFHVAAQLGRPVSLIHGDHDFSSADLVGQDNGFRRHKVVDNFIHSVMKTEEETKSIWLENRLTTACQNGDTLIYDEFNRSRPEANNPFLSIFSERILNLPRLRRTSGGYLQVHPEFRAIFTSNPEEYAGVHKTQDALMDRLITIPLEHYNRETEIAIIIARSGIDPADAETIVDLARELRRAGSSNHRPTIRACVAIARVLCLRGVHARPDEPVFQWVCRDVLSSESAKVTRQGQPLMPHKIEEALLNGLRAPTNPARNHSSPKKTTPERKAELDLCPLQPEPCAV